MYKIIGADGRQYGPVTVEQVRQWLKEGRANAHTKILAEGAADWKSLGDLPEFADVAVGAAAPQNLFTTARPLDGQNEAQAMAEAILERDYHLSIGSCISRGWNLVFSRFWLTVGATAVVMLVSSAAGFIPFASLVVGLVFWAGLDWMFLKLVRNEPTEFSDAFAGFSWAFVPLMLFSIVAQVLVGLGFLLCILPGIYLVIAWVLFGGLLILDKRLEFWPAMELSRRVVTRHWWVLFGLALVCFLLQLLGMLVCLIGFFITLPVTVAAIVYAYEDIFGSVSAAGMSGKTLATGPLAPIAPSSPVAPEPVASATSTAPPDTAAAPAAPEVPADAAPSTPVVPTPTPEAPGAPESEPPKPPSAV